MKIIEPYVEVKPFDGLKIMKNLEEYGRICYKSEDRITDTSHEKFIRNIIKRGHESVLEHEKITVKFVVDRGVSHELVRHRISSFSQESTRYANYSQDRFGSEITVIAPFYLEDKKSNAFLEWKYACRNAEDSYFYMLKNDCSPQEARAVLPNSLKTEVVMTTNIRDWRHFFKLRADKAAHPQMQQVAIPLLLYFKERMPVLFEDIEYNKNFKEKHYAEVMMWEKQGRKQFIKVRCECGEEVIVNSDKPANKLPYCPNCGQYLQ